MLRTSPYVISSEVSHSQTNPPLMSRNASSNKNSKVAKYCHQFCECGDSGSFGKILSKLPNSKETLKLIVVAILANLVIVANIEPHERTHNG